jgi:tetratricopeptide (TPR) repeat protein
MSDPHPSRRDLETFVRGDLDPRENLRVFLHLLPGCAPCREVTAGLWWSAGGAAQVEEPQAGVAGYETAVERVFTRVRRAAAELGAERAAAPLLLAELERAAEERREAVLRADPRFHTWGFCELLLGESRARPDHGDPRGTPRRAELCGRLAAAAAERLHPALHPPPQTADLAARAWSAVAEARRAGGDFCGAEQALGAAAERLARGTGDRLERAELLGLKAGLRAAQGRCDEAVRLLRRAAALYRRAGEIERLGRALLQEGYVHACAGDAPAAVAALREGLILADAERAPRLALAACHSLAFLLHTVGRHADAQALLAGTRPLVEAHGEPSDALRFRHLEARTAAALGDLAAAEGELAAVRRAFQERGMGYDAALASLDLAEVYARQGRVAELAALGESMIAMAGARDLSREAVAALLLFQKAARAEAATLAVVREVSARLLRLRREG